jgi:nucleotide-binding universal stress UspA family protein
VTFQRILVPLDGTTESNVALPVAAALARATRASITLVRVVALGQYELAEQASAGLRTSAEALASAAPEVDIAVPEGDAEDSPIPEGDAEDSPIPDADL